MPKTFGEFFDAVCQGDLCQGVIWMDDWVALVDDARWQEVRATPLREDWVLAFAEDILTMFRDRMAGICTDALYARMGREGRAFMQHIAEVAETFGIDARSICGGPATPSEAIMPAAKGR